MLNWALNCIDEVVARYTSNLHIFCDRKLCFYQDMPNFTFKIEHKVIEQHIKYWNIGRRIYNTFKLNLSFSSGVFCD